MIRVRRFLVRLCKAAKTHTNLKRIDAGIRFDQARVRNMHKAQLDAPVVLATQKMSADRPAGRKVYVGCARRRFFVGEKRSAADIYIGHHVVARHEIPFQREWIEPEPIGGTRALQYEKYRHNIDGILEPPFEEAGASGIGQNPSISRSNVPNPGIRVTFVYPVPPARPDL